MNSQRERGRLRAPREGGSDGRQASVSAPGRANASPAQRERRPGSGSSKDRQSSPPISNRERRPGSWKSQDRQGNTPEPYQGNQSAGARSCTSWRRQSNTPDPYQGPQSNQLGRRNLTREQFTVLLGWRYLKEKRQGERTDLTSGQNDQKSETAAERIAADHNVSEKTVRRAAATVESLPELTPAELLLQICCKTSGRGGALSQICLKAFAAARCYKSAPTLSARRDGALCQICVKTFRRRATCPKSVPRLLVATGHLVKSLSRLLTAAPQFQMSSRTFRRLIARRVRKPMK